MLSHTTNKKTSLVIELPLMKHISNFM